eukprot:m.432507 g.432507  ORF g.432507 m.432507 type:complete len:601 (+) comp20245_c1_seq2:119-1921(+)
MGCSSSAPAGEIDRGAIKLRVLYTPARQQLIVRVKQAKNLIAADLNGASDAFVKVFLVKNDEAVADTKRQTTVKPRTLCPVWDEELQWEMGGGADDLAESSIRIEVWDKDTLNADDFLGSTTIKAEELIKSAEGLNGWFTLFGEEAGASTFQFLGPNWQPALPEDIFGVDATVPLEEEDNVEEEMEEEDDEVNFERADSEAASEADDDVGDISNMDEAGLAELNPMQRKKTFKKLVKSEKESILQAAADIGRRREAEGMPRRHITVVYNPVSGNGTAKRIVDRKVTPILRLAHVEYDVVPTQYAGFAIEFMKDLDLSHTDGVLIAGGDGLVHEVLTGYCLRSDKGGGLPIGIVPSGTANAMAHELHQRKSHSQTSVVGWAAVAAAANITRDVDVLEVGTPDGVDNVYALSVLGWGLAGAVALQAAKMRWIPGQKKFRYDLAGFVTMVKSWPVINEANFNFLMDKEGEDGSKTEEWESQDLAVINLIVTNMSALGLDHPIIDGVAPDDGYFGVCVIDGAATRTNVIGAAMGMKKGKFMGDHKCAKTFRVREVKIEPKLGTKTPYNIDGDPLDCMPIHIKCLHKGVSVFAHPPKVTTEDASE